MSKTSALQVVGNKVIQNSGNVKDGGITLCIDSSEALVFVNYQNKASMSASALQSEVAKKPKKGMFGRWRGRRSSSAKQQQRHFKANESDSKNGSSEEKVYEGSSSNEDFSDRQSIKSEVNSHQRVVSKSIVLEKGVTLTLTLTVCDEENCNKNGLVVPQKSKDQNFSLGASKIEEEKKEESKVEELKKEEFITKVFPWHATTNDDFDIEDLNLEGLEALALSNLDAEYGHNEIKQENVLLNGEELNFEEARAKAILPQDNISEHAAVEVNTDKTFILPRELDDRKMPAIAKSASVGTHPQAEIVALEKSDSSTNKKTNDSKAMAIAATPAVAAMPLVSATLVDNRYQDLEGANLNDIRAVDGNAKIPPAAVAVAENPEAVAIEKVNAMKVVDFGIVVTKNENNPTSEVLVEEIKKIDDENSLQEALANLALNYKGPDELEFVLPPGPLNASLAGQPPVVTEIFEGSPLIAEGVVVGMMMDIVTILDPNNFQSKKHYEMDTLRLNEIMKEYSSTNRRHIRFVAPHYIVTPPPIPTQIFASDASTRTAITCFSIAAVDEEKKKETSAAVVVEQRELKDHTDAIAVAVAVVDENYEKNNAQAISKLVETRVVDSSSDVGVWTDQHVNENCHKKIAAVQKTTEADPLSVNAPACAIIQDDNQIVAKADFSSLNGSKKSMGNEEVEILSQMNYTWKDLLAKNLSNLPGEINLNKPGGDISISSNVSGITQNTNHEMKKSKMKAEKKNGKKKAKNSSKENDNDDDETTYADGNDRGASFRSMDDDTSGGEHSC